MLPNSSDVVPSNVESTHRMNSCSQDNSAVSPCAFRRNKKSRRFISSSGAVRKLQERAADQAFRQWNLVTIFRQRFRAGNSLFRGAGGYHLADPLSHQHLLDLG